MRATALPLLVGLALGLAPLVLDPYIQDLVLKIMVFAIFALSLELLVGMTGLVSLGHAAFFGIGAYVTVMASPEYDAGSVALLLPASMALLGEWNWYLPKRPRRLGVRPAVVERHARPLTRREELE